MKLGVALRLGRVSNLPTTWSNVLAGLVLAGGSGAARGAFALPLCAAISAFYVGGMYLNDAFDRGYDARERPERPIPSGAVSASTVFAIGFGLLAVGLGIVAALAFGERGRGVEPLLGALGLAALIVFYDAYHKQNPLSPVVMAGNRVLVYLTAAWSVQGGVARPLALGCLALLGYLIGLTYAAKQENLREPRGFWPLALMAIGFLRPDAIGLGAGFFLLCLGWTAYSVSFLLRGRRDVKRAVSYLIAGISLLDAMLIALHGELALGFSCVACFLATLFLQRFVPGT